MSNDASNDVKDINEGGRPTKYKPEFNEQAYKLCLLGAIDKDLADFFEVSESTINLWKLEKEGFSESIKEGKIMADASLADRLYKRAYGAPVIRQQAYKMKDISYDDKGNRIETERIEIVDLVQEQPPDTTALIFWLKNRNPDNWRDKQEVDHQSSDNSMPVFNIVGVSPDDTKASGDSTE